MVSRKPWLKLWVSWHIWEAVIESMRHIAKYLKRRDGKLCVLRLGVLEGDLNCEFGDQCIHGTMFNICFTLS